MANEFSLERQVESNIIRAPKTVYTDVHPMESAKRSAIHAIVHLGIGGLLRFAQMDDSLINDFANAVSYVPLSIGTYYGVKSIYQVIRYFRKVT